MKKTELRQEIRAKRDSLTLSQREQFSAAIMQRFISLPSYQRSSSIAAYTTFQSEVETQGIIQHAQQHGKKLYLPVVDDAQERHMSFVLFDENNTLVKSAMGILEPERCSQMIEVVALEFVIVPLLGFTRAGYRLGFGAGFYDVAFAKNEKATLCALAFSCQELDDFVADPWDIQLDYIVTEKEIISCK